MNTLIVKMDAPRPVEAFQRTPTEVFQDALESILEGRSKNYVNRFRAARQDWPYPFLNKMYGLNPRPTYGHKMDHCEFVEHRVFPWKLYEKAKENLRALSHDTQLKESHSYFGRLAWAGGNRDVNLIQLMLNRWKDRRTRFSPYQFYPTFSVERAYAKQGQRLLMNAESGFFCLAAFNFYPDRETKKIHTTLIVRNWAVTRMLSNLNGVCRLVAAINKQVRNTGLKIEDVNVYACSLMQDMSRKKIKAILDHLQKGKP